MKKQTISEIVDQRLDLTEVGSRVSQLADDMECCKTWRNYHLIGDVIRGDVSGGRCLMDKLRDALDGEPTVLAPGVGSQANSSGYPGNPSKSGSSKSGPSKSGLSSDAAKSAGLFAVAASIALVAVLTLPPSSPTGQVDGVATVAVAETAPGSAVPGTADQQMFESEFSQMLVEHGEFSATSGLNGLIAYAKLVTNEQLND